MERFQRIKRLPPYVFNIINQIKMDARRQGEDIIDLGMGNPDGATPSHIVDKLCEAARNPRNHRYSASRGIYKLRLAICDWYKRRFGCEFDPELEAIVTIGAKEGLSHLVLGTMGPGDVAFVPTPTYPIHTYSAIIAGADVRSIPLTNPDDFIDKLTEAVKLTWPQPKVMMLSFPHNPTTTVVDLNFFQRAVELAREYNIILIHDFAYSDLVFDDYNAPSLLQVPDAKDVGVEITTLSKTYNMAGWRIGFCVGNSEIIGALARLKSYMDYGIFQPLQIAAIIALNGPTGCIKEICDVYQRRRDVLVDGLKRIGWKIEKPKATMFVWGKIPEQHSSLGSLEFCKLLIKEAKVAVSPGIGFGEGGDQFVRFALVENEHRIRQAIRGIKQVL
ncbi:aminotransferase class I/II-fold pyridoxal phosphate-dependent enzyme [bacterium]|nr:aminotransferase class I/II-fold pyridoxal phosphate-dependent enzyme [bacterium]